MVEWGAAGAAICIVALLAGWAFRFAAAQQRKTGRRGNAGTVGTVAVLVAAMTGSGAAGGVFAERPADDPFPLGAGIVLAASVVVLVVGIALKAGAARLPDIHVAGVRGRGFIRSVRRAEAKTIQGLPVYEIDMDASAGDDPPFRVVHYEAIPERMGETIRAGTVWPILVDPATKRVALDWISPPPVFDEDLQDPPPSIAPVTPPLAEDPPVAATGSSTAATRTIALVLVMAMLGTGASFVTSLFDSDAPIEIVSDGDPVLPRVGGSFSATETGFATVVPAGWSQDSSEDALTLRRDAATIDVTRSRRLEEALRRLDGNVPRFFRSAVAEEDVEAARAVFVGVEQAMRYDYLPVTGTKTTRVVIARNGRVYVLRLVSPEGEWDEDVRALMQMVDVWQWYPL